MRPARLLRQRGLSIVGRPSASVLVRDGSPTPVGQRGVRARAQLLDGVDPLLGDHAPVRPLIAEIERELELRSGLQDSADLGRSDVQRRV